jgi:hypothetical protein
MMITTMARTVPSPMYIARPSTSSCSRFVFAERSLRTVPITRSISGKLRWLGCPPFGCLVLAEPESPLPSRGHAELVGDLLTAVDGGHLDGPRHRHPSLVHATVNRSAGRHLPESRDLRGRAPPIVIAYLALIRQWIASRGDRRRERKQHQSHSPFQPSGTRWGRSQHRTIPRGAAEYVR